MIYLQANNFKSHSKWNGYFLLRIHTYLIHIIQTSHAKIDFQSVVYKYEEKSRQNNEYKK